MNKALSQERRAGMREVASAANVSLATVYRVLNGNHRVAPAVRKAVLEAAAKLDFDPSQRNKTRALGFILSNRAMLHPFHSRILSGAETYCAAHGWDIVFLSHNYSPHVSWKELHLPKAVQRQDVVRGVILAGVTSTNLLEVLNQRGTVFAVYGNNIMGDSKSLKNDVVFSDDIKGGEDMTRYLIGLGHRQICFVGNTRLPWVARGFEGHCRVMEEAGLEPRRSSIDSEDAVESGYLGVKSLLARDEPVTAIFAGTDATAYGVYKGLRDSGLGVPDDVSVVGSDDSLGACLYPGLTTIREFPEQLGRHMVEMVLNRIANPGLEPQSMLIPTELIKRDSCRPVDVRGSLVGKHAVDRYSSDGR